MGHTGGYTREEAIAAIEKEGTLPDMLTFDTAQTGAVPEWPGVHRRCHRLPTGVPHQGRVSAVGLSPHTDTLGRVPISRSAACALGGLPTGCQRATASRVGRVFKLRKGTGFVVRFCRGVRSGGCLRGW